MYLYNTTINAQKNTSFNKKFLFLILETDILFLLCTVLVFLYNKIVINTSYIAILHNAKVMHIGYLLILYKIIILYFWTIVLNNTKVIYI